MRSREPFFCCCCCSHICLRKVIGNFLCQISFNYFSGELFQRRRRSVCVRVFVCVCDLFSGQMIAVSVETRIENKTTCLETRKGWREQFRSSAGRLRSSPSAEGRVQETDGSGDSGEKKKQHHCDRFRSRRMRACGQQRDARPLDESVFLFRIPGL